NIHEKPRPLRSSTVAHQRSTRVPCLALVAALVAMAPSARAGDLSVDLSWSSPDGRCIGATELSALIEHAFGARVFLGAPHSRGALRGHVGPIGDDRFEARLALHAADGRLLRDKVLDVATDCRALDESIAIVASGMLDELARATPTPAVPPVFEAPVAATPAVVDAPVAPASKASSAVAIAEPWLDFGLGLGGAAGLLPSASPLLFARVEIAWPEVMNLALSWRFVSDSAVRVAGIDATVVAMTGELTGCPAATVGAIRLGLCGGIGAAAVTWRGTDGSTLDATTQPMVFVTALPFLSVSLSSGLNVRAEAGAWLPLGEVAWRALASDGNVVTAHEVSTFVGVASLTLQARVGL
ncbi:MAG: hypothetical protein ACHREM_30715, partial [Polyangiales bacterium]